MPVWRIINDREGEGGGQRAFPVTACSSDCELPLAISPGVQRVSLPTRLVLTTFDSSPLFPRAARSSPTCPRLLAWPR